MMTAPAEVLCAMDAAARSACTQELRRMIRQILRLMPTLRGDDREFAQALLLKLDHLVSDQQVGTWAPAAAARSPLRAAAMGCA